MGWAQDFQAPVLAIVIGLAQAAKKESPLPIRQGIGPGPGLVNPYEQVVFQNLQIIGQA